MRTTATLISLFTLISSNAFAQWEVRPAPASWNLPQTSVSAAPQMMQGAQAPSEIQNVQVQRAQQGNVSFTDAVTCSAALQLATMAAPNWSRERGISDISNAWLQKVFALGEPQGVGGDKVPGLVEAEMQRQMDGAASDPSLLSRRAFDCASRQP
jgi:hypothetical protein